MLHTGVPMGKSFPIGLLQMSVKITNEAPAGMKAGIKGSYHWVTQDMLDAVSRCVRGPARACLGRETIY